MRLPLLLFVLLAACGGDTPSTPAAAPPVTAPVVIAPTITSQPGAQSALLGERATFTVTATGTAPLVYQWKRNNVDIAGATLSTYTATATKADTNAQYTVTVSNEKGNTTSSSATLVVQWIPEVVTPPASRTVAEWDTTTLSLAVDARPVATYQWRLNGQDIAGAVQPTYRVARALLATSGSRYSVRVSNAVGSVISTDAVVNVQRPTPTPFELRGFNFSSFGNNYWEVPADNELALQFARSRGSNLIVLDWMIEFNDDGTMAPGGGASHERVANIVQVISRAKALGFTVALKPHAISTTCCGQNRALFNTDTSRFLASNFFPAWQSYLLNMMDQLPMRDVSILVIGTEMDIFDWRERARWQALISAVRAKYAGQLTYDAMYKQFPASKDIDDVVFWDLVDFISTSLYVQLTRDDNANVETLIELFRNNPSVEERDAIGYLRRVSERFGKRIMAIEGGYQSANGALWQVNGFFNSGFNEDLQARGLDAYLTALNISKQSWFRGVSLWDLQPRHFRAGTLQDPNYRAGWGMANKLSADVVRRWFSVP